MAYGLENLPKAKWSAAGKQPILKADFLDIETAILQVLAFMRPLSLQWVDATAVRVLATADSPAGLVMVGFPNILHPKDYVSGGLSDGKYRKNLAAETLDFDVAADRWGTEKGNQWYAALAIAGDADAVFTLKAMPFMRFSSQASQVITLRNNLNSADIGYGFVTDELVGGKIYVLSGTSAGLMREITANNNDDGTGGTITYSGAALSMTQGDWFIVLPNTNFRLVGEFINNSSANIAQFLNQGDFVQWVGTIMLNIGDTEDINLCSPLAKEARVTMYDAAGDAYGGHADLTGTWNTGASVVKGDAQDYGTVDITLNFCQYQFWGDSIHAIGYRKIN